MAKTKVVPGELAVRPLTPETWVAFADLAERHNGVWGGCWCTFFHTLHDEKTFEAEDNRALKERLVAEGRAHAALVFDGDIAVGWCEYGAPRQLPNINLYNGTRSLFEQAGFTYSRPKGKNHCVMSTTVSPA
jgi:hypothetical protein